MKEQIRTKSYVTIDEKWVDTGTLSKQIKNEIGMKLKVAWMNAMFCGKARFYGDEYRKR